MKRRHGLAYAGYMGLVMMLVLGVARCTPSAPKSARQRAGATSDAAVAAQKVYVPPGDLDEYYMFASGGQSGNIYVYGLPSMRHIATIPVFTPYPGTGYGFDDDSKAMLGGNLTWGDADWKTLYMPSSTSLYRVPTRIPSVPLPYH